MLTPDFRTMVAALALTSFLVGFHLGPIFAVAQTVAKPSMRALASAIELLTAACFGQGVGPLAVGMLNDAAEKRLWRQRRALFAVVGRGHDHAWRLAVHLGRSLDSERHPTGKADPDRSILAPTYCFICHFCPGGVFAAPAGLWRCVL